MSEKQAVTPSESLAMFLIREYYGDQKARRSNVPYISHIEMGVEILRIFYPVSAPWEAKRLQTVMDAYALHPIFQMENNGLKNSHIAPHLDELSWNTVLWAQEYKATANAYLCKPHYRGPEDVITLSDHRAVNMMLVADKIQNRIDFERYYLPHAGEDGYERAAELDQYFKNWLTALSVTEEQYQRIAGMFSGR